MTIKEQIKILDNKIRQNKANYDLYRQNEKEFEQVQKENRMNFIIG